jgi:hypothetical protein
MNSNKTELELLFTKLAFPKSTTVHKFVAKNHFLQTACKASDKKLFTTQVKQVYWEYSLKPTTCQLLASNDGELNYQEIAILSVKLINNKSLKRLANIIHQLIPYPLMLVFCCEADFALSIAPKRLSKVEHESYVIENCFTSEWLTITNLTNCANDFINSLSWHNSKAKTYTELYDEWLASFVAYDCSLLSNRFNLATIAATATRIAKLATCNELQDKIAQLRKQFKQANFNRQVELNIAIKQYEQQLQQQVAKL